MHKSSPHYPYVQPVLSGILHNSSKCKFLAGPFQDERQMGVRHRKDVFLAQIALATNGAALVVSTDTRTRADLTRMGLKALSLKDALSEARQKSC